MIPAALLCPIHNPTLQSKNNMQLTTTIATLAPLVLASSVDAGGCTDCWCGSSWGDANLNCNAPCPDGTDAVCGSGHCYADITGCGSSGGDDDGDDDSGPPPSPPSPSPTDGPLLGGYFANW